VVLDHDSRQRTARFLDSNFWRAWEANFAVKIQSAFIIVAWIADVWVKPVKSHSCASCGTSLLMIPAWEKFEPTHVGLPQNRYSNEKAAK
jgi:hypothetical protein